MNRFVAAIATALFFLAAAPPADAQQADKVYRIGFLTPGSHELFKPWLAAFRQGLHALGYVEGKNVIIEQRFAAGKGNLQLRIPV